MKVAIFSDLHDNRPNLDRFLAQSRAAGVKSLIFCGDLASLETLIYLRNNFSGKIYLVGGNADFFIEKDLQGLKDIYYNQLALDLTLGKQRILVVHKPADLKKQLADTAHGFDFAFYGHTHKPWLTPENGLIIANPGTLRESFGKSSFAV